MPRMSGREATEQIRKIEAADSHIPIIALTAHGLSDERDRLIASGIDDYVGKPISQPQLLQVLQKWLGRATAAHHMAASTQLAHPNLADSSLTDLSANNPNDTQLKANDQDNKQPEKTQLNPQKKNKKMLRPLSLKKIRDNYLRDNLHDTLRDNLTDTQSAQSHGRNGTQARYSYLDQRNLSQSPVEPNTHLQQNQSLATGRQLLNLEQHSAANATERSEILDWQDALTRSANKPDLAAKLIIMMLDTIADEKESLAQAWQAKDRHMLAQIAHRILGASRYTGVPQLRLASQNLEDKCLLNVQHTTPAQFAMLQPYYKDLMTALNNLQNLDLSPYSELNYHRLSENDMNWKMI